MKSFNQLQKETRAVHFGFLMTDLAAANTFLDVAHTTRHVETRARNIQHATTAYAAIARLSGRLTMTAEQSIELKEKLQALEQRLRSMEPPLAMT